MEDDDGDGDEDEDEDEDEDWILTDDVDECEELTEEVSVGPPIV